MNESKIKMKLRRENHLKQKTTAGQKTNDSKEPKIISSEIY